jgi:hypothetical protein
VAGGLWRSVVNLADLSAKFSSVGANFGDLPLLEAMPEGILKSVPKAAGL